MSWAGRIVGCCNERRRIAVDREPGRKTPLPLEYFTCDTPDVPLDWMLGSIIDAGCAGGPLNVGGITVGKRTGANRFALNTTRSESSNV